MSIHCHHHGMREREVVEVPTWPSSGINPSGWRCQTIQVKTALGEWNHEATTTYVSFATSFSAMISPRTNARGDPIFSLFLALTAWALWLQCTPCSAYIVKMILKSSYTSRLLSRVDYQCQDVQLSISTQLLLEPCSVNISPPPYYFVTAPQIINSTSLHHRQVTRQIFE